MPDNINAQKDRVIAALSGKLADEIERVTKLDAENGYLNTTITLLEAKNSSLEGMNHLHESAAKLREAGTEMTTEAAKKSPAGTVSRASLFSSPQEEESRTEKTPEPPTAAPAA